MILVYVTNERLDEVADLPLDGKVGYRNPQYWKGEIEKCDSVYIHGHFPELREAYKDKLISLEVSSTDYTIAELREMRPSIDDWDSFTKGDTRKSIKQI